MPRYSATAAGANRGLSETPAMAIPSSWDLFKPVSVSNSAVNCAMVSRVNPDIIGLRRAGHSVNPAITAELGDVIVSSGYLSRWLLNQKELNNYND